MAKMSGRPSQHRRQAALWSGALAAGGAAGAELFRRRVQRRREVLRELRELGRGGEVRTVTTSDGTALHVEVDGPPDAPLTVIFIHGYFLDLTTWRYQRAALAGSPARLVFYDHRGYGRSEPGPKGQASIRLLAQDLYQVIEAAAPQGPVVLVGHSMGSLTIQALAGIHPELFGPRVVASVLISTAAQGSELVRAVLRELPFAHRLVTPVRSTLELTATLRPYLVRALGHGMYRPFGYLFVDRKSPREAYQTFVALIAAAHLDVMGDYLMALASHEEFASLPTLGKARTLVVTGERDLVVLPALSETAAQEIPGAEHVIMPGSGHMVPFEKPEEVNSLLTEVITSALPATTGKSGTHI